MANFKERGNAMDENISIGRADRMSLEERLRHLVVDDTAHGRFEVDRAIFRDPEIFLWEMQYIFESSWIFLAHESLIPNPHDFYSTFMGRQPVIVMRDGNGEIGVFLNTCPHRGALIATRTFGNKKFHRCNYHGWIFGSNGKCISIRDQDKGAYSEAFLCENHDLVSVPKVANYRGWIFASLGEDVPEFSTWLGDVSKLIDLVVEQGPDGVELLPGAVAYTYDANWKLQLENCPDAYHLLGTHPSFMTIVSRRSSGASNNQLKAIDFEKMFAGPSQKGGSWTFPYGHALVWAENPQKHERPLYAAYDELKQRVGEMRAEWMFRTRNLTVFPNVQFAENASLLLRVMMPLAPNKTEMRTFCIAPRGEAPEAREYRLRQCEDFFNPSGMATPDDTTCYEDCQSGYQAFKLTQQQGYDRGMTAVQSEQDEDAKELGLRPATSVHGSFSVQDETVFHSGYREWIRLIANGLARG
jgi:phenylpropionate dioxygenase-like ring-hydroxylating dioxygenase large terminal subunit